MVIHDEGESFIDTADQDFLVIDIDIEFTLESVMNEDAGPDAKAIIVSSPVGFEGDGDSIPSVPIDFPQSFSTSLDDTLGDQVGFLLQVRTTKSN